MSEFHIARFLVWPRAREIVGFYPGNPGVLPGISRGFTGILPVLAHGGYIHTWALNVFTQQKNLRAARSFMSSPGAEIFLLCEDIRGPGVNIPLRTNTGKIPGFYPGNPG